MKIELELPPEVVGEIIRVVKAEVLAGLRDDRDVQSPYLTIQEAAAYARCSKQRVYDLRSSGRLSRAGDGTRAVVLRAELDVWLANGRSR